MKQTVAGQRLISKISENEIMAAIADGKNPEDLIKAQIEKDRSEKQAKLKTQERKFDYYERALHVDEIPLLKSAFETYLTESNAKAASEYEAAKAAVSLEHSIKLAKRNQLKPANSFLSAFKEGVMSRRNKVFEDATKEYNVAHSAWQAVEDVRHAAAAKIAAENEIIELAKVASAAEKKALEDAVKEDARKIGTRKWGCVDYKRYILLLLYSFSLYAFNVFLT